MCPTTSLLHRCIDRDADAIAILGAARCMLLTTGGTVLCDIACSLAAQPTAATQLPDGTMVVGDAQGGVSLLRMSVHSAVGVVARLELPHHAPTSIRALTHLPDWGGFAGLTAVDRCVTRVHDACAVHPSSQCIINTIVCDVNL